MEVFEIINKNYITNTYSIEDLIKFLNRAGFSVINSDSDNIEIKDEVNKELLQTISGNCVFESSTGKKIELTDNFVKIEFEDKTYISMLMRNEGNKRVRNSYQIGYDSKSILSITSEFNIFDFIGKITTNLMGKDCLNIKQMPLETIIWDSAKDERKHTSIDDCNLELYIKSIMDFLSEKCFFTNHPYLQEAFRIILISVKEDIESIFNTYNQNLDEYIKQLEKVKEEAMQQYIYKISMADKKIAKLRSTSESKKMIKK